jgi:hypothetical protein
MTGKQADQPTNNADFDAYRSARAACDSIITNLPDGGDFEAINGILKELEQFKPSYSYADLALRHLARFLNDYVVSQGDDLDQRAKVVVDQHLNFLDIDATNYFEDRIVNDTKNDHVGDILVEMERLLEDSHISTYFRQALESVRVGCEKKIERQRKRSKIRKDLEMFDEPNAEPMPEPDTPKKFTRKQAMALLQALIPEFTDADNVAKAAFIVKLTPYIGERNIAQEYSYLRSENYDDLVEEWKEKLRKSGRGRKKRTT